MPLNDLKLKIGESPTLNPGGLTTKLTIPPIKPTIKLPPLGGQKLKLPEIKHKEPVEVKQEEVNISVNNPTVGSEDKGNPLEEQIAVNGTTASEEVKEEAKDQPIEQDAEKHVNKSDKEETDDSTTTEETPKKTRRRRKTHATVDGNAAEEEPKEFIYSFPKTEVSFETAVKDLGLNFVDEEWEKEKAEIIKEVSEITVSSDMLPAAVAVSLSQLSHLRDKLWLNSCNLKTLYAAISSSKSKGTEGLIERVKALNYIGDNENIRKKNGIVAAMSYTTTDGSKINLYDLLNIVTIKNNFYYGVMNQIQFKTECLKGIGYTLTADAKLTPYMEG